MFSGVLSANEFDELMRLSCIKLQHCTIVEPHTGVYTVIDDRSSDGTFFGLNETALISQLDRRIAEVLHMPIGNGECLQILNHKVGGGKTHINDFPPTDPGSAVHTAKEWQRVSKLVIYLNDVESCGETIFPNVHISVFPKKGSAA